jgi:type I restriction enzyme R subunit
VTSEHSADYLVNLVRELCKLPKETEWLELKVNNTKSDQIGEYISALSNSAALASKAFAYVVWGVTDGDHDIVGTTFKPHSAKIGGEDLENWLLHLLSPKIHFQFFEVTVDGKPVVLLKIERAFRHPVQFKGQDLIRVGSHNKKLKEIPDKARALWQSLNSVRFEQRIVAERLPDTEVLRLLDFASFFELLKLPLPGDRAQILEAMADEGLVLRCEAGGWNITSLGGILFAKRLGDFNALKHKAVRVTQYRGTNILEVLKDRFEVKGYAAGFEELVSFVTALLPSREVIDKAIRRTETTFPEKAIRELVANALVHQDFDVTGIWPSVEIFADRVEIRNAGVPLVPTNRFVDKLKARNENLASLMRRMGICEELGSGWDRIVLLTESHNLPAPLAESSDESTSVVLFAPQPLAKIAKVDRVRAVYLHACVRHVNREAMTNSTVRERFGLAPGNSSIATRLIREAVTAGVIKPYEDDVAPKQRRYAPAWAVPSRVPLPAMPKNERPRGRRKGPRGRIDASPHSMPGSNLDESETMPTNTSERGLEDLIVEAMTGGTTALAEPEEGLVSEPPALYGVDWLLGNPRDYDREYAVDLAQLGAFLRDTQPKIAEALDLDQDGPTRRRFLARLQGEVSKRGVLDVLRKGVKHGQFEIDLFYGRPSPGNRIAYALYGQNRFSLTRQLRYSHDKTQLALDLALFVNGLPVATLELKNSLTKQTVDDAVQQYMRSRDPREKLFELGRCIAHFAVDEHEVRFCTHLRGMDSWFLPFNQGWNDGAGNPPNPLGLKTDYLWRRILTRESLTDILENFAQIVEVKDERSGRKRKVQIFPRYHQLEVVRRLLDHTGWNGVGQRYLIQHSAGSGKSNSIAWLAHQLIDLRRDGEPVFDSILVVTDRRILDQQIRDTIKQFAQVGATVGHADHSGGLRTLIQTGKKIIISTVQKFPFILDEIGSEHRGRRFAILIDEAHSSQGGKASAALNIALSEAGAKEDEETTEDAVNRIMESRRLLPNASYFAFTATPKPRTLEIFGEEFVKDGKARHRPFHSYTMKQAIQEGFILDVLQSYTPVESYYKLVKKAEGDPELDRKRAMKKLRRYVESHDHAIRLKAEIMVDHFHEQVLALNKIGGEARAMVVTDSIARAVQYFLAIRTYLEERKSPYKAIVAFSGEHEKRTEASHNGFPSSEIPGRFREDSKYRFLVCAEKFQTGYDEPLLHTMYVDKHLAGIKAVQTLSRLNRAHPKKHDVFVLDFMNDTDTIQKAFADYYRTTILSEETDPNKLHDLKAELNRAEVYTDAEIEAVVEAFLAGAGRERIDPALDACVAVYRERLDEDEQVELKGTAKEFLRTYGFLSSILPYTNAEWEKLSIFLTFLVPKLPAPKEEDLAKGILEAIDMDSYRVEKKAARRIQLPDSDAEIAPAMAAGVAHRPEPELDRLSNILKAFNDLWGNIAWEDRDRVQRLITQDIPAGVAADVAYQNAVRNSDEQNVRIELEKALPRVMNTVLKDDTQLFKMYWDNESFRRQLSDLVFRLTYERPADAP